MQIESGSIVGIDWGTTNRRAYWIAADGSLIAEHDDEEGMLATSGRFHESLDRLLDALGVVDPAIPVVMSGMVGSASGWIEAPYLASHVPLLELHEHLVAVPAISRRCAIVPGYRWRQADAVDVMRGEETQLLGAVSQGRRSGWFVLPGTHSKWVRLEDGVIVDFTTYMTGELFALLGRQGTLAAAVGKTTAHVPEAFLAGLRALPQAALSHTLFGCRALAVSGDMPEEHARSYISGLLIGAEWRDVLRRNQGQVPSFHVTLIGSPELATYYAVAATEFGAMVDVLDPRSTYIAALKALRLQE